MVETATRQGDGIVATGSHMGLQMSGQATALNEAGGALSLDRQASAERFRLLMAKLRKSKTEPAGVEAPPAPALETQPQPAFQNEPELPPVLEIPVELDEPLPVQASPPGQETATPEPVAELDSLPYPCVEKDAVPAEESVAQMAIETQPQEVAAEYEDRGSPSDAEAMSAEMAEISMAIYAVPSPEDRAKFLSEAIRRVSTASALEQLAHEPLDLLNADLVSIELSEAEQIMLAESGLSEAGQIMPAESSRAEPAPREQAESAAPPVQNDADGELARSLLDMMLSNSNSGLPQERALAADALLKLIPRVPLAALVAIVNRVSIMESPPHMLVSQLILDPRIEVSGPLLENCGHISEQILARVVATGQANLLRLIARRRVISTALSDQLIACGDTPVILTMVRNNGVSFSHQSFLRLADHARRHPSVLAPLATRPDLPSPIAFELFWSVPAELRRYLLSRFLTDSEMLTKILKITQAMQVGEASGDTAVKERQGADAVISRLRNGKLDDAASILGEMADIQAETAARIIADRQGEPLAVVLKALGINRAKFAEIIELLKQPDCGIIDGDRSTSELQGVFDSLSFNKARVLLTYWDWAMMKSGPYAPAQ